MSRISTLTEKQNNQNAIPHAVQWHGAVLDDLWDDCRDRGTCQAQGILIEEVKADLIKHGLLHT